MSLPLKLLVYISCLTAVLGSQKKGLAVSFKYYQCGDFDAFNNFNWWYDWSAKVSKYTNQNCPNFDTNVNKFVPMIWGYYPQHLATKMTTFEANGVPILGFNEPNHINQSNIEPIAAAEGWAIIEEGRQGRPLISPAAAECGNFCLGNTTWWFDEFFQACNGCLSRLEAIATHHYPWDCTAQSTIAFLDDLYDRYGKPIWLTEFACPNTDSVEDQLAYMQAVLPLLESRAYVQRYAWYITRSKRLNGYVKQSANLLNPDTSQLTSLGQYYNGYTSS